MYYKLFGMHGIFLSLNHLISLTRCSVGGSNEQERLIFGCSWNLPGTVSSSQGWRSDSQSVIWTVLQPQAWLNIISCLCRHYINKCFMWKEYCRFAQPHHVSWPLSFDHLMTIQHMSQCRDTSGKLIVMRGHVCVSVRVNFKWDYFIRL